MDFKYFLTQTLLAILLISLISACTSPSKQVAVEKPVDALRRPATNDQDYIKIRCDSVKDEREFSELRILFDANTQRYSGTVHFYRKPHKKSKRLQTQEFRIHTEKSDQATRNTTDKLVLTDGFDVVLINREPTADGQYKGQFKSKYKFFSSNDFTCRPR